MPLGAHDKVLGRAEPTVKIAATQPSLRKDANKGSKTQGKQDPLEAIMKKSSKKTTEEPEEEVDEPHMIPESAILRSLKDLRSDRFYMLVYIRPKTE